MDSIGLCLFQCMSQEPKYSLATNGYSWVSEKQWVSRVLGNPSPRTSADFVYVIFHVWWHCSGGGGTHPRRRPAPPGHPFSCLRCGCGAPTPPPHPQNKCRFESSEKIALRPSPLLVVVGKNHYKTHSWILLSHLILSQLHASRKLKRKLETISIWRNSLVRRMFVGAHLSQIVTLPHRHFYEVQSVLMETYDFQVSEKSIWDLGRSWTMWRVLMVHSTALFCENVKVVNRRWLLMWWYGMAMTLN